MTLNVSQMESKTSLKTAGTVKITAQGHLLTVTPTSGAQGEIRRGDRGVSNEFTQASRNNLLRIFATITAPDAKGYRSRVSFVTLTMKAIIHPREAKKYLFTFLKRWRRKYPTLSGIWKLEAQQRGAPHFHMILYNSAYIPKEDIQSSWAEIIGEDKPFTRIERCRNYRQGVSYVAKYLGKLDGSGFNNVSNLTVDSRTGEVLESSVGRRWGIFNRFWIPWDDETTETVQLDGSWWLIRRYAASFWENLEELDYNGFSLFIPDPENALKHMVKLAREFSAVN